MRTQPEMDLPETNPSEKDVEALYDELFGTPILNAPEETEDKPVPTGEVRSFTRIYKLAKRRPWLALYAVHMGVAAHFRGAGPFDYSVDETRTSGEVAQ
ncbi:hypothetical protein GGP46_000742 [Salinibacter ruber]|nr:hypothetical protein [Salinibacter ruber]